VDDADIAVLAAVAAGGGAFVAYGFNRMALASFNPELARARGVRVVALDYAFVLLVTFVTVAAVKIIGAILVEALLIVPAAAARNVARSLGGWIRWSVLLCTVSGVVGILGPLALDLRIPSGAAIVLVAAGLFGVSALVRAVRRSG